MQSRSAALRQEIESTPLVLLDSLLFVLSPMLERIMRRTVERAYALRSLTLGLQLDKAPATNGTSVQQSLRKAANCSSSCSTWTSRGIRRKRQYSA